MHIKAGSALEANNKHYVTGNLKRYGQERELYNYSFPKPIFLLDISPLTLPAFETFLT